MNKYALTIAFLLLQLTASPSFAEKPASASNLTALANQVKKLEKRLVKIENLLKNKILIETVDRLDDLQNEIQQVRGDVENIDFKVQSATKRNRNYFIDTDRRINELEIASKNNKVKPITAVVPIITPQTEKVPEVQKKPAQEKPIVNTEKQPIKKPTQSQTVKPEIKKATPIKTNVTNKTTVVTNNQSNKLAPNERKDYMAAFNFLKQGRYQKSLTAFSAFLNKYPNGRYADNAQYWLAESNYVSRFFDTAIIEFNKVITIYPSSPKVADARLKLGYSYYEKAMWAKAKSTFKNLIKDYPNTSIASLAKRRLKRLEREGH